MWSKEKPKESGVYWTREKWLHGEYLVQIVEFTISKNGYSAYSVGEDIATDSDWSPNVEIEYWSEKIKEPE